MRLPRKVVVGHWQDAEVRRPHRRLDAGGVRPGTRLQALEVARFGDNMRQVAVTEGDKVEAQIRLGVAVNGYGVGDLVERGRATSSDADGRRAGRASTSEQYELVPAAAAAAATAASRCATPRGSSWACGPSSTAAASRPSPTPSRTSHGLAQLPGLAVQRLMADGYGFGAEGDWKTAALVRVDEGHGAGLAGGTSFMEDYTYHLDPDGPKVLGAHMLEICPSIAAGSRRARSIRWASAARRIRCGWSSRAAPGPAVNAALIDLGDRFRLRRTRSMSCRRTAAARGCRSPGRSGSRGPI